MITTTLYLHQWAIDLLREAEVSTSCFLRVMKAFLHLLLTRSSLPGGTLNANTANEDVSIAARFG